MADIHTLPDDRRKKLAAALQEVDRDFFKIGAFMYADRRIFSPELPSEVIGIIGSLSMGFSECNGRTFDDEQRDQDFKRRLGILTRHYPFDIIVPGSIKHGAAEATKWLNEQVNKIAKKDSHRLQMAHNSYMRVMVSYAPGRSMKSWDRRPLVY